MRRVRRVTRLPIAVGFGISLPGQVSVLGGLADAAVVGSALVQEIEQAATRRSGVRRARPRACVSLKQAGQGGNEPAGAGRMSVEDWRRKIDEIDRKLVELLNERSQCVLEIGRIKKAGWLGALSARPRAAGPGGGGASQSRPAERGGHPAVIRAHSGRSALGGAHRDARRGRRRSRK